MTLWSWLYVAGYPIAVLVIMRDSERKRRKAQAKVDSGRYTYEDVADAKATLRPALDGLLGGLIWPAFVLLWIAFGALWLLSLVGRWVA